MKLFRITLNTSAVSSTECVVYAFVVPSLSRCLHSYPSYRPFSVVAIAIIIITIVIVIVIIIFIIIVMIMITIVIVIAIIIIIVIIVVTTSKT